MASFAIYEQVGQRKQNFLWWKIGILLVIVIAFVLAIITFLNYSNYRKTYLDLNLSRHLVLAKDLHQTIETGLNIGIKPAENLNLLPAIRDQINRHAGIRYIGIINDAGEIIGEGLMPAQSGLDWKKRISNTAADGYWLASNASTFQLGMVFMNNFNIKSGAVVIGYDRIAIEDAIDHIRNKLCMDVLLTLSLVTFFTLLGVYVLTRKFAAELFEIGHAIESTLGAAGPHQVVQQVLSESVANDINDFTRLSHQLAQKMADFECEISSTKPLAKAGGAQ
jgi:sensor histidine kinase regulating citrate/malate metabolism